MVAATNSPELLDVTTDEVFNKQDLDESERTQYEADNRRFPVFGVNVATQIKNVQDGYTTAWAVARETVDGKWVFPKPTSNLLDGVTGFTVVPYDPAWFPPEVPV